MTTALLVMTTALSPPTTALRRLMPGGPGFAVVENFLPQHQVALLKEDVAVLQREGRFELAGVGAGERNRLSDTVRRCEQCFLYPKIKHGGGGQQEARSMLYSVLDSVRTSLQQETGEALDGLLTEGLYAAYPQGGYYRRHIDSYSNTPQALRKFSFLLYANDAWKESDGGHLRIHTDGGGELAPPGAPASFVDVEPRAGTLVLFRSDVPHEVLDTNAARLAAVGWFNAPPEGSSERRTLIGVLGAATLVGLLQKTLSGRDGD